MPAPRNKTKPPKKQRRKPAPKRKSVRPRTSTRIVCKESAPVVARPGVRYRNALQVPSRMQLVRRNGGPSAPLVRSSPRPTLVPQVRIQPRAPMSPAARPGVPAKPPVPSRPTAPVPMRTGPRFVRIRDEYY